MKTLTFNVLKKNRKYFAAEKNGYKCKIIIDENSENLTLGVQELLVNDKSVSTKYGTDLIYELARNVKEQKDGGICTLTVDYNSALVERCKELGGRFDYATKSWVFSDLVAEEVEELDFIYGSKLVGIELTVKQSPEGAQYLSKLCGPIEYHGYTVVKATGRDSGAVLSDGVAMLEGDIKSGGSLANWRTLAECGSRFVMYVPQEVVNTFGLNNDYFIGVLRGEKQ